MNLSKVCKQMSPQSSETGDKNMETIPPVSSEFTGAVGKWVNHADLGC